MTNAEIEAFLTICEQKSISKAAERLFISQSSLSTKIKTLEKEIGCPLFVRAKGQREVALTDEGMRFYDLSVKYQEITREMLSLGSNRHSLKLRVSTPNSLGSYIFSSVYELFISKMPDVSLEIQDFFTKEAYESIENGFTDIGFTGAKRQSKKAVTLKAFSESMVFVCSKKSKYPDAVDLSMLDIKNELFTDWCDTFNQWHKDTFGQNAEPQIKFEIMTQLEFFIKKSNAWAIVPASAAHGLLHNSDIRICRMLFEVPNRVIHYFYVPDKSKSRIMSCFLECLTEVLERMTDLGIEIYI